VLRETHGLCTWRKNFSATNDCQNWKSLHFVKTSISPFEMFLSSLTFLDTFFAFKMTLWETLQPQGWQIFRGTKYPNGENIPNDHKIYQSAIKYLYQMYGKFTKWPYNVPDFRCKNLPNLSNLGFLVWK
jgi:hypothetical protein